MSAFDRMIQALKLIKTNTQDLTEKGHAIINSGIKECLAHNFVRYNARKNVGYELTPKGLAFLNSLP